MNQNLKMKELPDLERPDEKCIHYGVSCLSDAELLAAIIRTGIPGERSTDVAQRILTTGPDGLLNLLRLDYEEMKKIRGIGKVKAVQLQCIGELARRIVTMRRRDNAVFDTSQSIAGYYMEQLRHEYQEQLILLMLNTRGQLIRDEVISIGTDNQALISPPEIFKRALICHAHSIVLVHNHPSGDPTPSSADITITKRIKECGDLLGITLLDHVIIGDNRYYSFNDAEILGRKGE